MLLCGMTAYAQTETSLSVQEPIQESCNFEDSLSVYWQALNETVTLHTQVSQEGTSLPRAKLQIEFPDGKILDLGDGGKYYDDFSPDNAPSCAHILATATNDTIVSLNDDASLWRPELYSKTSPYEELGIKTYRSMSDLRADLIFAEHCNVKDEDINVATQCEIMQDKVEKIAENESNLPKHKFDSLVLYNAPIITVTRSTYYSETYIYDRSDNSLHKLYYDGC